MKILIQNARAYQNGALTTLDILLEDGIVTRVKKGIRNAGEDRRIDAAAMLLAPGFTDLHVHLRQPGYEQKETIAGGTAAAAAGGFTTVCAMPNLRPVPDDRQHLQAETDLIERDAKVWVLPYAALTVGEEGGQLSDIPALAPFVAGFSDDGRGVQDEDIMRRGMESVAAAGGMIAAHCEVESLLPADGVTVQEGCDFAKAHGWAGCSNESEAEEVARDIRLAEESGCHLHVCHCSAAESFALVRAAKARGVAVTCEATPHNLLLTCDDILRDSGEFRMNPPLRRPADRDAALAALLDGTLDAVATDHAPHTAEEKTRPFGQSVNGVAGLEIAFPVLYTHLVRSGKVRLERLLALLIDGPRRVLGLPVNEIAEGERADFVLIDLLEEKTVGPSVFAGSGRATPFAGWALSGWPVLTCCDGQIVYES